MSNYEEDFKKLSQDSRNIINFFNESKLEGIELDFRYNDLINQAYTNNIEYLDGCHNFIQWLLPSNIPSQFNPDAPIVQEELLDFFKKYSDVENIVCIAGDLSEAHFSMIGYFKQYFLPFFFTKMPEVDHNYLRITRLITSMRIFSDFIKYHVPNLWETDWACLRSFLNRLLNCSFTSDESKATLIKYWTEAMGEEFYEPELA